MKKIISPLFIIFILFIKCYSVNVYFDSLHAQDAGNSDWTISGAYSELSDLLDSNGFNIIKNRLLLTEVNNKEIDILVIPEPNNEFNSSEIINILDFVRNGGSLFLIGNHSGADRNRNGFDSVKIFNQFSYHFGFMFNNDNFTDVPLLIKNHPLTQNVRKID